MRRTGRGGRQWVVGRIEISNWKGEEVEECWSEGFCGGL